MIGDFLQFLGFFGDYDGVLLRGGVFALLYESSREEFIHFCVLADDIFYLWFFLCHGLILVLLLWQIKEKGENGKKDSRHRTQDSRLRTQDSGHKTQDSSSSKWF